MNAFHMVQRCAIHQWRGLPEQDRCRLNALWSSSHPFAASLLHVKTVAQVNIPLWEVKVKGGGLDLMSIKTDWLGDVP